jgi:hypothetical protein
VLFQLAAGKYTVAAVLSGEPNAQPRSTTFTTSGGGAQQRVEIQFTHMAANQ